MVTVDIERSLYAKIQAIVKKERIKYPSVKYFIQHHLVDALEDVKK